MKTEHGHDRDIGIPRAYIKSTAWPATFWHCRHERRTRLMDDAPPMEIADLGFIVAQQ